MASLVVSGDTSGAITLSAPSVAGTNTLSLPAQTATLATLTTPSFATTIGVGGATAAASGAGITFPASQSASTDANTLDDYEEGTWTPIYYGTSTAGTTTYTTRGGTYTKIGSIVFVEGNIQWSSATGTGQGYIGGLPFTTTSNSPTDSKGFVAIAAWNGYSITGTVFAIPSPSATNFELYAINNGSLASSSVQSSGAIRFQYFYIAA